MKISLDWLNEYVKVDLPTPELLERLTMIGLVAENAEERDGDTVVEVETYANRPDTLGHLGIAREVAAMLGEKLVGKDLAGRRAPGEDRRPHRRPGLRRGALSAGTAAMLVKGVKVGPSPDWLRRRIEAMGLRPINNVVDVSNYVLFATAQPLHAFDFAKLRGGRIIVRKAQKGENAQDARGRDDRTRPGDAGHRRRGRSPSPWPASWAARRRASRKRPGTSSSRAPASIPSRSG